MRLATMLFAARPARHPIAGAGPGGGDRLRMKTVAAHGVTIPQNVLLRATRIVE